jgi:hypothetical protein
VISVGDDPDRLEDFEQALRAWAERPTRLSPEQASRAVVEAARQRRRRATTRRTLLAAAALAVVVLTLGIRRDQRVPAPTPPPAARLEPAPLEAGQALIWLDQETPLYMTFEAPQTPRGGLP